ncbi:unnamed protein product [Triticum turgidum subsp. durum]|uniref:Uncharacterized protein n=1 Tax=Triticum turgidum subsp. durum TaxID=4567 RepID=A0A9R0RS17_TRITD|nr:unnamed protein product [Triticum turgidum subsp. durum]
MDPKEDEMLAFGIFNYPQTYLATHVIRSGILCDRRIVSVDLEGGKLVVSVVASPQTAAKEEGDDGGGAAVVVARGEAVFAPERAGTSNGTCDLGFCKVEVAVAWASPGGDETSPSVPAPGETMRTPGDTLPASRVGEWTMPEDEFHKSTAAGAGPAWRHPRQRAWSGWWGARPEEEPWPQHLPSVDPVATEVNSDGSERADEVNIVRS